MHTVVFGWFGGSAVWFIPLLWRLVKSALPGGAGLRGPGTIRLWLGFVCVLVASCTLEASLIGVVGVNGFGHALAAGFDHLLGHIGTPLAALALFLISLPWLIDFRWRDFAAWADGAFGLGLSRGLAKRDDEARRHRSVDDGLPSHSSAATNTMAPKSNGRYARPTVWRPPASPRGAGSGAGSGATGKDAATRGTSASWRTGSAAPRNQTAQAEPVLRTGQAMPPRHAPVQTNPSMNSDKPGWLPAEPVAPAGWLRESAPRAGVAAASMGAAGGAVAGSAARASGDATRDNSALQVGRRSAGEQRPMATPAAGSSAGAGAGAGAALAGVAGAVAAAKTVQAMAAASAMSAAPGMASAGANAGSMAQGAGSDSRPSMSPHPASAATSAQRATAPRPSPSPTPQVSDSAATQPVRRSAPSYTRPMATTQAVTPPASVQETLRSIAENTARWTDMAGVSLARSSGAEGIKLGTVADDAPSSEVAEQADVDAQHADAMETTSPTSSVETAFVVSEPHVADAAIAGGEHAAAERAIPEKAFEPPHMEIAAGEPTHAEEITAEAPRGGEITTKAPIDPEAEPVIQWPIEPAIIHPPLTAAPTPASTPVFATAPATAPAPAPEHIPPVATPTPLQIFAAQLQTSEPQKQSASGEDSQPIEPIQSDTSAQPASLAEDVVREVAPEVIEPFMPPAATHVEATAPLIEPQPVVIATQPFAEVVIGRPLVPWEDGIDELALEAEAEAKTEPANSPALPNTSHAPATPPAPDASTSPVVGEPANPAASPEPQTVAPQASNVVRFPVIAAQAAEPVTITASTAAAVPVEPVTSEPPAASIAPSTVTAVAPAAATEPPAAETAAPRPPMRGHSPANGFEFRAPAASMVELPTLDLLAPADTDIEPVSEEKLIETGLLIEQRLQEFKVPVTVVGASAGPVITRFEVEPALGVRGSQIVGLMKDLSRGLGLTSIRVVETIPGKTCMGLELPNAKRQTIRLSEILEASVYQNSHSQLTLAMGKDITGHPVVADLAKAPHMLVAGTTGSGKSVAINAMICSLLFKATPEEVRLIMIDPKMLELSVYEGIPHLLAPVVTDMKLAANALNWCVGEMEKRYRLMSAVGVRNLPGFNQKIRDTEAKGKKLGNPFSLTPEAPEPLAPLPLIVVVIDELADLMMVAGKKIEELIARLAQKARAAGIHLILATQRPSVDVITGLIKANIPTRVAFQVSSKIDSRTILDQMGAESLLGQGDMLFLPPGTGYPQRVHGAFVADEEVHRIVEYLKQFGEPQYEEGILDGPATDGGAAQDLFGESPEAEADPLYDEAVAFVVRTRRASISSVQRQLRIGYNRAARLVEQMETAGLVSAMGINGSREVLAPGPAE